MINFYLGLLNYDDRRSLISDIGEQQLVLDAQLNNKTEVLDNYMNKTDDLEFRTLQKINQ